jgi:hypothetical protein
MKAGMDLFHSIEHQLVEGILQLPILMSLCSRMLRFLCLFVVEYKPIL